VQDQEERQESGCKKHLGSVAGWMSNCRYQVFSRRSSAVDREGEKTTRWRWTKMRQLKSERAQAKQVQKVLLMMRLTYRPRQS
jgi:hypothetical protein